MPLHTKRNDLGPVQRKLYRVLVEAGNRLAWADVMPRMGGRCERDIIKLADRANRLHGQVFLCDAWGVYVVRVLN